MLPIRQTKIVIHNNNNDWLVVSAYPYDEPTYYNEIMPGGALSPPPLLEWPGLLTIYDHRDGKLLYNNEYKKDFPPLLCPSGEGECKPIS